EPVLTAVWVVELRPGAVLLRPRLDTCQIEILAKVLVGLYLEQPTICGSAPTSSRISRIRAACRLGSSASTWPPGSTQYGVAPGQVRLISSNPPSGVTSTARTHSINAPPEAIGKTPDGSEDCLHRWPFVWH